MMQTEGSQAIADAVQKLAAYSGLALFFVAAAFLLVTSKNKPWRIIVGGLLAAWAGKLLTALLAF
jgi:chromate transport protein ChrA